jgi:uncharacterized protein YbcI
VVERLRVLHHVGFFVFDGRTILGTNVEEPRARKGTETTKCVEGIPMRTKREIETAISEEISRFEQNYMGRGPKDIHVHLLNDLLLIRLRGVLAAAEQHLVELLPSENGRDLLKRVRSDLIETTRPVLEAMAEKVTGVKVVTMHHDISTITGEEVILFTLARSPDLCEAR